MQIAKRKPTLEELQPKHPAFAGPAVGREDLVEAVAMALMPHAWLDDWFKTKLSDGRILYAQSRQEALKALARKEARIAIQAIEKRATIL